MRTTREGKRFILAAVLISFAALNTGNNLVYLILALLLSFILLAFLILRINLSKLSMDIAVNSPVFAGDETVLTVTMKNAKRLVPAYSLHVYSGGGLSGAFFPFIPARGMQKKDIRMKFEKRGLYRYGDFSVESGFPFILFRTSRTIKISGEVLVYPMFRDVDAVIRDVYGSRDGEMVRVGKSGEDIYSLREFRHGDDWRKIHWKASAKSSTLLVREFAEFEFAKTTILLDNLKPQDTEPGVGDIDRERSRRTSDLCFEKIVSLTASLVRFFLDKGHHVRVISCKKVIPFGCGDEHLYKILDILALICRESSWESPLSIEGDEFVVSVTGTEDSAMHSLARASDMVIHADSL